MSYDLGDVVPLGTTVRDANGTLANAGSMELTITQPDGTAVVVSPVVPVSTGTYAYDFPTVQSGRHVVRWVASGVNAGAYVDVLDVRDAVPTWIISLADAKTHLKLNGTSQDEEVRRKIGATTRCVEWFVGPVAVRTVTETHNVGQVEALALHKTPALELVAVAAVLDGGTSYTVAGLDLDPAAGIVRRKDGGRLYGPLRVTYTAGRRIVPENIAVATELILQHLWRTQAGPGRPQLGTGDFDVTEPIPGLGYAIPNRALQLLDPDNIGPGMA
ncbi:hypothetical protein [Streptomyces coerulescens]|uniref:Uncharacterized protein n=1 Tax=Streptomyces coerulescens TaxID=29304 RepID=A0ABW0CPY1_STRCD